MRRVSGYLLLAVIALVPAGLVGAGTVATASAENANLDGKWKMVSASEGTGYFIFADENVTSGTFSGQVVEAGGKNLLIESGLVTGTSFTFVVETPGTVVGEDGAEFFYAGTVSGNTMNFQGTASKAWSDGTPIKNVAADGKWKGTRTGLTLGGTVEFGCTASGCTSQARPLYDATIVVDGPTSGSTTTNTEGKWSLSVAPGHYTITPSAPDVTFSPESMDVDVATSQNDEDFGGCSAGTSDASSLREPRVDTITWSLTGDYCYNKYQVTYQTVTKEATVTWISHKYICDPSGRSYYNAQLGRTFFDGALVGSPQAPGDVTTLKNRSVQVNVRDGDVLVLEFSINPSGTSAIVKTNVTTYSGPHALAGGTHVCEPVPTFAGGSKLPYYQKR